MIMVFSIMLMMTTGDTSNSTSGQSAPQKQENSGRSGIAAVSEGHLGKLAKKDGRLRLIFGKKSYDPQRDVENLESDKCIRVVRNDETGRNRKILYIEEDTENHVLLAEYLTAFQHLSHQGIDVAFAERIK